MNIATLDSPIGRIGIAERDGRIVRLLWTAEDEGERNMVLDAGIAQLSQYFAGTLDAFDLPLDPGGSAFQRQVYAEMQAIPRGETRTYGDIANALGVMAQPVGQACGSNPIPIIIPCHRVVGRDGLGGFSAPEGIEMKVKLLRLEGAYSLLI